MRVVQGFVRSLGKVGSSGVGVGFGMQRRWLGVSDAGDQWSSWEYGTFTGNEKKVKRATTALHNKHEPMDALFGHISESEIDRATGILWPFLTADRVQRIEQVLNSRTDRFRFVFENPTNPNNVWAALRTFDSFGIQFVDIIIDDNVAYSSSAPPLTNSAPRDEFNSSQTSVEFDGRPPVRATMSAALGSQKWLTLAEHHSSRDCIAKLKSEGYIILATDIHEGSLRLPDIEWQTLAKTVGRADIDSAVPSKVAFVMGNELRGISKDMKTLADASFYVPMRGFAESLNLSVACAVISATLESQHQLGGGLRDPLLRNRVLFSWLLRSVKVSLSILRRHNIEGISKTDRTAYNSIGTISSKP